MKITRRQLRRLIKEELTHLFEQEAETPDPVEPGPVSGPYDDYLSPEEVAGLVRDGIDSVPEDCIHAYAKAKGRKAASDKAKRQLMDNRGGCTGSTVARISFAEGEPGTDTMGSYLEDNTGETHVIMKLCGC